jgi:hypothetical protein
LRSRGALATLAAVPPTFVDFDALPGEARTWIVARGSDAERFLQGTLSADVVGLDLRQARAATLLTVKGRIVSDAVLVRLDAESLAIAVPRDRTGLVADLLERHIVMDDVALSVDESTGLVLAFGEGAERVAGPDVWVRDTVYPAPGRLCAGPRSALAQALSGATPATGEQWARVRIATGSPAWGREVAPDRFPPEVGLGGAVSHHKGCFLGQEPLARLHARGHVNWVLVRIGADAMPPALPVRLSTPDREHAGDWTSAAPEGAGAVGLAIVHRELARPGIRLSAADGTSVEVRSDVVGG